MNIEDKIKKYEAILNSVADADWSSVVRLGGSPKSEVEDYIKYLKNELRKQKLEEINEKDSNL